MKNILKKYELEIEKWMKSEEAEYDVSNSGYPKTKLSKESYVEYRKEGFTPSELFGSHYIGRRARK